MTDLYATLGVDKNVSDDDIRKAYKRLAVEYHPDKNKSPGAEDKFKEIQNAYSILSNPEKRRNYDQFGINGIDGNPMPDFGFSGTPFENIFQHFGFQFGRNAQQQRRRADINITIPLTYEEIYLGCIKNIKYNYQKKCSDCNGSGGSKEKCIGCGGQGRIKMVQRMGPMQFINETLCNRCNGSCETYIQKCLKCNGNKNMEATKEINIQIPPGMKQEFTIIEQNAGHEIENVVSDLKIMIEEKSHIFYKRNDLDIKCRITISLLEALVGFEKEFVLLDGSKIKYATKDITKPHTKLCLKGYGFPNVQNKEQKGNLICYISIEFPDKLEAEFIEKLINGASNNKQTDGNKFEVTIDKEK